MKAHAAILTLAALAASAGAAAQPAASAPDKAAAPAVKPGLWETTTVVEEAGSITRRSVVGRICVQATDAMTVDKILPAPRERGMPCENRDVKRDGSGWSWTITCRSPEGAQTGAGKIALSGDGYLGRAELELRRKSAKPVKVKHTYSGQWIGGCT